MENPTRKLNENMNANKPSAGGSQICGVESLVCNKIKGEEVMMLSAKKKWRRRKKRGRGGKTLPKIISCQRCHL